MGRGLWYFLTWPSLVSIPSIAASSDSMDGLHCGLGKRIDLELRGSLTKR